MRYMQSIDTVMGRPRKSPEQEALIEQLFTDGKTPSEIIDDPRITLSSRKVYSVIEVVKHKKSQGESA